MTAPFFRRRPSIPSKPVIGVLCCNETLDRPIQSVASRFIDPLSRISGATVLLVPALPEVLDMLALVERLDGLLLTGSRSNVSPARYGGKFLAEDPLDERRDAVALLLAERMIEAGRSVFGICRGLQELNVLFGGTLARDLPGGAHHRDDASLPFEALFEHQHEVTLAEAGELATASGIRQVTVNSVHRQGIDRLGSGLTIEAVADDDGLIEAFSASPCGGQVLAVQWHPEWNGSTSAVDRGFFRLIGQALRGRVEAEIVPLARGH
ncbi:gamma-glutamyl-gamma-aminobutyrate hydrolase family protein [Sphingomonas sp. AOB5]|uniref:gamma-glutamyl-gamma-aminobutyrate hydrolase family protein n=1 Tax=Sphingomonas sp. AOB5 TaxID=3034017 RepID=UPI0023F9CD51|nr:gamma-glutamyl-gamma-aminobutyrate hydrolase family protein [Sphingomonas sp. AOB5]MDF7774739.1 gamma-glutamyl-gamma-aminobutyrate hydrolase family protein [Sphingomonas sp. AOB5]